MARKREEQEEQLISCLKNQRVTVRFIPRPNSKIQDPKHVLYGGMAENAVRTYYVPKLSSGKFVNVLTDAEKDFLEDYMGLEPNAMSIYKAKENFWSSDNLNGISNVRLTKGDNFFDLSNPMDYIRYKILLANKDFICPSLKQLQVNRKATYQYVIINEGDELKDTQEKLSVVMKCYKEYGKIEDNFDVLKFVLDTFYGKAFADSTKIEFLQAKANEAIQTNSQKFHKIITDPLRDTKVLIRKGVKNGSVSTRGNYYYLSESDTPLCDSGLEPTLENAAKFLNSAKNQDMKFLIEAKQNV